MADINDTAPRAAQLTASVKIILGILEDQLGYETSVIHRLSEKNNCVDTLGDVGVTGRQQYRATVG